MDLWGKPMATRTPLEQQTHALYRFFGAGGTLLYIGITNELPRRLRDHNGDKDWWTGVANVSVEHFPNRPAVLEAERRAIIAEKPLYNDKHNSAGRWDTAPQMAASSALTPICMECREPIPVGDSGVLHVADRDANEIAQLRRGERQPTPEDEFDEWLGVPLKRVAWLVHCDGCNPHWDWDSGEYCESCYTIGVDQCRTWAQLIWWTCHLKNKTWMPGTNWFGLIRDIATGSPDALFTTNGAQAVRW